MLTTLIAALYVGNPTQRGYPGPMSGTRRNSLAGPFGWVVLVASQGGMKALSTVVAGLPASFPLPVVVAQHRRTAPNAPDVLAEVVARRSKLPVRVAIHGDATERPGVAVVPAGMLATIGVGGGWSLTAPTSNVGVGDAFLMSSAKSAPTIAVVLTGRLTDGAAGCRAVKLAGGRVLVQDPFTAEAPSMPATAIATGCVDFVLPLDRLATAILALSTAPGAAELLTVPVPPWAALTH